MSALIVQYFLNHRLDLKEIEWQVEEIGRAGYQGLYAHARQGLLTPYMSEDWWRAIDKILEVCRRTGLEFWIWDEDYFPSGLAGGRVVWEEPGWIARGLEFSITRVEGEGPFEVDFPPGLLLRAFAILQRPTGVYEKPQDVTSFCGTRRQHWKYRQMLHRAYSPGMDPVGHPHWRANIEDNRFALRWTPPQPGRYVLLGALIVKTSGLHPDILRPEGVKRFLELSHERYGQRYGPELGGLIRGSFTDEPSPGGPLYPWTPRFPEEFQADHGYDLLEQLPHLALDLDQRSPAVRHHYRLTQHRLQRDHYVGQIARWCEEHGLLSIGHLTRTEWLSLVAAWWPNELRCYQPMHIPAADPLGASCGWSDAAPYHTGLKVASSAAHLFGRAQASSDALAVVGDEASLRDLKYMLDYQMVLGINHFSIHGASYSLDGPRKDEVPPSLFYQHTEWKYMRVLLDHVRRTCEALTGGQHLCTLAVLYPSTSLACQARTEVDWYRLPDEARIHQLVEQLLSHQRDFDFIDEVTLREKIDEKGSLTTPEPYRVILLPHLRYIDVGAAEALQRFAQAGGRVIAIGEKPRAITSDPSAPLRDWLVPPVEFFKTLDEALLQTLPGLAVQGPGARDVFVLRRQAEGAVRTFLFNRREEPFAGTVEGETVHIAPRGSVLWTRPTTDSHHPSPVGQEPEPLKVFPISSLDVLADWSSGWTVTFEPNHLPLNFWHVALVEEPAWSHAPSSYPGFDLMRREADPAGAGNGRIHYFCRFMLTGEIPDARLVMEDSTLTGEWVLYVNDVRIDGWQRARVFDCHNLKADVGAALRGGSTPTLNVLRIEAWGPGRGLHEVPYLYGSFTCEYRYGHLSFPFLKGPTGPLSLAALEPWDVLGYPTFSGSACYHRTVEIAEPGSYLLDLGRVEDVAAVRIEGKAEVVLAWPPYQCLWEVASAGTYALHIKVTNPPANRNRAARRPAGLLGPVRLLRL